MSAAQSRGKTPGRLLQYDALAAKESSAKREELHIDLLPDIRLSAEELNQGIKARAEAVLADVSKAGLTLTGAAFWAELLFVTRRRRADLSAAMTDALAKVSAALGFSPVQTALLCEAATLNGEQLQAYVAALGAHTLVVLEAKSWLPGEGFVSGSVFPYTKVVEVSDFFGSLDVLPRKRMVWQELQAARRPISL